MNRYLMTLILGGFIGSLVLVGSAEACHKKKSHCAPATCVVEPAPCPPPAPVVCESTCCAPKAKRCGGGLLANLRMRGHGRKVCASRPMPCATSVQMTSVVYSAPVTYSSPQASAQH
jgi:hypothetical protein